MNHSENIKKLEKLLKDSGEHLNSQIPSFNEAWLQSEPGIKIDEVSMKKILKMKKIKNLNSMTGIAAISVLSLGIFSYIFINHKSEITFSGSQENQTEKLRGLAVRVKGVVFIEKNGKRQQLVQGKVVERGNYIETVSGEVDIALTGGTILRLKNEGRFQFVKLDKKENSFESEIFLEKGSLYSVVDRLSKEDTYTVKSPTAIAGVRGTAFTVTADEGKTEIKIIEGKVSVRQDGSDRDSETILEKGKGIVIAENSQFRFTELKDMNSEVREFSDLKNSNSELDKELLDAAQNLSEVKSEDELKRFYNRDLIEIAKLKDGRELHGLVVSQVGDKIIFQTVTDSYVLNSQDIDEISYKNE
ncbi:MAG: FecR family protein [Spirochaetia bacterium]|nr:FecR family protein [Spirochaetia bacterium]